jgi:hypothetical protein
LTAAARADSKAPGGTGHRRGSWVLSGRGSLNSYRKRVQFHFAGPTLLRRHERRWGEAWRSGHMSCSFVPLGRLVDPRSARHKDVRPYAWTLACNRGHGILRPSSNTQWSCRLRDGETRRSLVDSCHSCFAVSPSTSAVLPAPMKHGASSMKDLPIVCILTAATRETRKAQRLPRLVQKADAIEETA